MKFTAAATVLVAAGGLLQSVGATVLVAKYRNCINGYDAIAPVNAQLNVTSVLASLVPGKEGDSLNLNAGGNDVLRLDLIGTLKQQLVEFNETSGKLATLFTSAYEAGVKQWESRSRLCTSIFPSNATKYTPGDIYCPIPPGDFGINVSIPLYNVHELATLQTQIHIVDNAEPARTLACVDVRVTPYTADSWPYRFFLWFPAALAMGYWVTTWAARFAAGWVVSVSRSSMARREVTMLKWGTMIISGLSGERFGVSAALLRFVTPGLRDIMFHIQFVTMLGMININWPSFFYPIVSQSSWADLVWNVSIVANEHQGLYPTNYTAPLPFKAQLDDKTHPLYLNAHEEPRLMDLQYTPDGMSSFAKSVGLRQQDLFGTCLSLFLMLAGGIIVLHFILWCLHWWTELLSPDTSRTAARSVPQSANKLNQSRPSLGNGLEGDKYGVHSRSSSNGKEWFEGAALRSSTDLNQVPLTPSQPRATQRLSAPSRFHRVWKRFAFRGEAGAFHFSALYGNLLRLIVTFHFPITAFSVFQLTLTDSSIASRVLAALALAFISVLIPAGIMYKISRTPTGKLYDAARTLLALGTMYNVYEPEKQLYRTLSLVASLVQGVVVGAGQKNGLAQTVVLAVTELFCFVMTTVWSPWGEGAGMGGQVVFISILRISSLILAMVLCQQINVEESVQQWLTYAILILQAIIFVFFFFMLITKIVEGLIRLFGGAPFDESTHPMDGGIFAAIMDLDCFNGVRGGKAAARKRRKRDSQALQRNVSVAGSLTTQMMFDKHSQGVERQGYPLLEQRNDQRSGYSAIPRNTSIDQLGRAEFGHRPSLSDQGSMLSERMTDESHGRILDAWKPAMYDGAQPPLSPSEKSSMKRQSWGGPPQIRVTDEPGMMHTRGRSSSAIMEELASTPGSVSPPLRSLSTSPHVDYNSFAPPPSAYPPARADREGRALRPPPLSIPRRRSLNNINLEDDERFKNAGKRRSWGSSGWFARGGSGRNHDDSESEDDHDDPYDEPGRPRGWRAVFSRRRRVMDQRARREKQARKAIAVNASGAAFAGVSDPVSATSSRSGGFRVHRKAQTASGDALAAVAGTSSSTTPLLAPPPASSQFRVHRGGGSGSGSGVPPPTEPPAVTPPGSIPPSPAPSGPLQPESSLSAAGPSSFRVHRNRHSPSGSTVSSPQQAPQGPLSTVPEPAEEPAIDFSGYAAAMFQPLDLEFGDTEENRLRYSNYSGNSGHSGYGRAL